MKQSARTITMVWLAAAWLVTGCVGETDETILLPVRVRDIPESVLPAEMQEALEQQMPIYRGDRPARIEGAYVLSPVKLVYASDGYQGDFYDIDWEASELDWWNRCIFRERQGGAEGEGQEAWVIGTAEGFTLYTVEQMHDDEAGWDCLVVTLVSGRKTDRGISGLRWAVVMHDKRDAEGLLVEPDTWRVFADGDGVASVVGSSKSQTEGGL
ncbi:MAG: hypothetical protein IJU19_04845 [Bacteroidales bacterium]|nr:hypothetical protein [Bacteroidales bacterium]